MDRRSFVAWGLRAALAAQLLGADLLDAAESVNRGIVEKASSLPVLDRLEEGKFYSVIAQITPDHVAVRVSDGEKEYDGGEAITVTRGERSLSIGVGTEGDLMRFEPPMFNGASDYGLAFTVQRPEGGEEDAREIQALDLREYDPHGSEFTLDGPVYDAFLGEHVAVSGMPHIEPPEMVTFEFPKVRIADVGERQGDTKP